MYVHVCILQGIGQVNDFFFNSVLNQNKLLMKCMQLKVNRIFY